MKLPYVIDNQTHVLKNVLEEVLKHHRQRSLDVATAYFTATGFGLIREGLKELGSFRLLLGAEPLSGDQLGLKPGAQELGRLIRKDLETLPFDEKTLLLIEELIGYLRRNTVQVRLHDDGFLHAKAWLFYSDAPQGKLFDRFRPMVAIVGSSNFTAPGLTSNRELNLVHKVLLDPAEIDDPEARDAVKWVTETKPNERITSANQQLLKSEVGARAIIELEQWFERQWNLSKDFKNELIELLDASKFGEKEYTPYQVYLKALFEYFRDDLKDETPTATRSIVELAEFQEDAVKKARRILATYDGVMIADSVGLGKTWIGKKLLEEHAYHLRQKALVICPAALREMWEFELKYSTIAATVLSQEELGRLDFDVDSVGDADFVLVDECHNFRNPNSQRYEAIERILQANGGRGKMGSRKKVVLLSATPVNNDLLDLYHQLNLITGGDASYFAGCGIGNLHKYFIQARRDSRNGGNAMALYNLLEEVVIRRTRQYIQKAYPEAMIRGKKVHFPERKLKTVQYDLEGTYAGIYEQVVSGIESLKLAPYNLESYKKAGERIDEMEMGREEALVGIFKSRYLKRFESSIEAFRISVKRALQFLQTFETYALGGKILKSADFHKALRYLVREDEEDDGTPASLADELDGNEDAKRILASMVTMDPSAFELRKLHSALEHDRKILTSLWEKVKDIEPDDDLKLQRLKSLLAGDLNGKKVLIFSYYRDTARYLYRQLGHPENPDAVSFKKSIGDPNIRRMDSGEDAKGRQRIVQEFAPKANQRPDLAGSDREIDVLISTDVLSEGQNLQDCGYLLNYDLHWNPTRMVQRAGRIDRIGSDFEALWIYNMFPDAGLERLLKLVESLAEKIGYIDGLGLLDASILGEAVHPKNFNTLKRIRDEDGSVIAEQEQFAELVSNEFLLQQLKTVLGNGGQEVIDALPDGIHSGLVRAKEKGIFFYFRADLPGGGRRHFWKYVDLKNQRVVDNRFTIGGLIACAPDTQRVIDPELRAEVFQIQEQAIKEILDSFQSQQSLEVAPKSVDPIQTTIATVLQSNLQNPKLERKRLLELIRFVQLPMRRISQKALQNIFKGYQSTKKLEELVVAVEDLAKGTAANDFKQQLPLSKSRVELKREDLKLICYEFVSG